MFSLIKRVRIIYVMPAIVLYLVLAGCGASDSSDAIDIATAYVDAESGDDTVLGMRVRIEQKIPFKSITRVIVCIESEICGYTQGERQSIREILVSPGVYDINNGEMFPILVPDTLELVGEYDAVVNGVPVDQVSGSVAIIRGEGVSDSQSTGGRSVGVVLQKGSKLRNFVVESVNGIGVWSETSETAEVARNVIQNSQFGIGLAGTGEVLLRENIVSQNVKGIELLDSVKPILTGNTLSNNDEGLHIRQDSEPNAGISTNLGNNIFVQNILCDLHHSGGKNVSAIGNFWDDDVFEFQESMSCSAGANIADDGLGNVDYRYVPSNVVPLFPGTSPINLVGPEFGQTILTKTPDFTWVPIDRDVVVAIVLDRPPVFDSQGNLKTENIKWLWHSGLETSIQGSVSFADGISITGGDLSEASPAVPLVTGSHYWAVWAWSNDATRIDASSILGYFIVSN